MVVSVADFASWLRLPAYHCRPVILAGHCGCRAAGCRCCTTQALMHAPPLARCAACAHTVLVLYHVASLLASLLLLSRGLGALLPPAAALLRLGAVMFVPLCSAARAHNCAGSQCLVPLSRVVMLCDVDGHPASAQLRCSARGRHAVGSVSLLADIAALFMLCRMHMNRSPRRCSFPNMRSTAFSTSIARFSG
jgi:hypothetical protein